MKVVIIGIAGASGSGKTTFSNELAERIGFPCIHFSLDDYYHALDHLLPEERFQQDFNSPDLTDFKLIKEHLFSLRQGQSIHKPVYDFVSNNRTRDTILVDPAPVIIVEGFLALHPELFGLYDFQVYLDTAIEKCVTRRMTRDIVERGRSPQEVCRQLLTFVIPAYYEHVITSKKYAHYIIDCDGEIDKELLGLAMMVRGTLLPKDQDVLKKYL